VYVAELPGATDCEFGVPSILKSAPLPSRIIEFVPVAFELNLTEPVRGPGAEGVNVTLKVQDAEAATVPTHELLLSEKSPDVAIEFMTSKPGPAFESLRVCALLVLPTGWAGKLMVAGESDMTGRIPDPPKCST
jgi:hypothetical protein